MLYVNNIQELQLGEPTLNVCQSEVNAYNRLIQIPAIVSTSYYERCKPAKCRYSMSVLKSVKCANVGKPA